MIKMRVLGKTGLQLSELGFGGAAIGNLYRATSTIESFASLGVAWEAGFRYFDTAPLYGYGLSERRMGDSLRSHPHANYVISTKVGRLLVPDASPKHNDLFPGSLPFTIKYDYSYDGIMRSFEDSLQRMGLEKIDIVYVHDIDRYTHGEGYEVQAKLFLENGYRALQDLRSQKVIQAIGLAVNEWEAAVELIPHTDVDCIMLAGRYTLLEQSSLRQFFPQCKQRNISIIVSGPHNSGILAYGKHYNHEVADEAVTAKVEKLRQVCDEFQISLPHAAIQFPLLHPQVVSVVAGIRTQEQASAAVRDLNNPIPDAFWAALKERSLLVAAE